MAAKKGGRKKSAAGRSKRSAVAKPLGRPAIYDDAARVAFDCEAELADWLTDHATRIGISRARLIALICERFRADVDAPAASGRRRKAADAPARTLLADVILQPPGR